MSVKTKKVWGFSLLLLLLLFVFPLWTIDLGAPQYPEGIGLHIWVNKITGINPHDLDNINGLNHYIGMKKILPDMIPELKIMPYFVFFLLLLGTIGIIWNKRLILYTWCFLFIAGGVVGLVDFYNWEYDYGHDLNPKAAIKVPGMAYQPPLIGSKQLLNITATSLPGVGGMAAGLSLLLTAFAGWQDKKWVIQDEKS